LHLCRIKESQKVFGMGGNMHKQNQNCFSIRQYNQSVAKDLRLNLKHILVAHFVEQKIANGENNMRLVNAERCYIHNGDLYADILRELYFLNINRNTLSKTIFTRLHKAGIIIREIEHYQRGTNTGFRLGEKYPRLFNCDYPVTMPISDDPTPQDNPKGYGAKREDENNAASETDPLFDECGENIDPVQTDDPVDILHVKINGGKSL